MHVFFNLWASWLATFVRAVWRERAHGVGQFFVMLPFCVWFALMVIAIVESNSLTLRHFSTLQKSTRNPRKH